MTAQQLKNSILQMAVQGKLVPQDPADEPASVLVERIRAEKEQLVKEKKIKKEKNPSHIYRGEDGLFYEKIGAEVRYISEELPFDLPESWEWVRLGNVGETNIGLTYKPSELSKKGIAVLRSNNIQNGMMNYSDLVHVSCSVVDRAMAQKGDILICARNGSRALVGKSAIVDKDGMAFGAFMAIYRSICNQYVQLFINSYLFRGQLDGAKTTTINQVTQLMLKEQLCPLPPLAEQQRIVNKYNELLPSIEKYDIAHSKIQKLNKSFPEQLKKSVLQWAVQGKLVEQDPTDEPASVLLERIRTEKAQLIKDGKIKKDKQSSTIYKKDGSYFECTGDIERCIDEEIPFEIPESWEWVRLGSINKLITKGASPKWQGVNYVDDGLLFITSENVGKEKLLLESPKYLEEKFNDIQSRSILEKGDILTNIVGASIGRTALYDVDELANINQAVCLIRLISSDISAYLLKYLNSETAYRTMLNDKVDTARANISLTNISDFLIPVPPLAEQQRIVAKVEEVLRMCEGL